jgi:hypothetical protein
VIPRYTSNHRLSASFFQPPLLLTESKDDFVSLHEALTRDLAPRGAIEQIFVAEIATYVWEILRLQRCRTQLINLAFEQALFDLLERVVASDSVGTAEQDARNSLIRDWFTKPKARKQVADLLAGVQLDEAAIEAEAMCGAFEDLERLDRLLTLQQARRDKLLRNIAEYRESFATQVREVVSRAEQSCRIEQLPSRVGHGE